MGKKKVFPRTDLTVPKVEHTRDVRGRVVISLELIRPPDTVVRFPEKGNASGKRSFDFARWYGAGIDCITYACQRQIERFLATHDGNCRVATVVNYCHTGLSDFLDYCVRVAEALDRPLTLADVTRDLIDGFVRHLDDGQTKATSQKRAYTDTKSVLVALGKRKLITVVDSGDERTFPRNPFPNSNRQTRGEKPLPLAQRKAFTEAVKTAVMPLLHRNIEPTSELLAYALLVIALHTGRNTTPLIEMGLDCLRAHPKDKLKFLVVRKWRGNHSDKVPVRDIKSIESTPTVWTGVVRLIERVIQLTAPLRDESPDHLKTRLWLYRSQSGANKGEVVALRGSRLAAATAKLVRRFELKDANGDPLRINVSILRKTFV